MIVKVLELHRLLILCISVMYMINVSAQVNSSNNDWKQYGRVEQVGFSSGVLESLRAKLDSTETSSLFVVYRGNVLFSYGDNTRKYMLHSIRKSIMNAMIGIEIENGTLSLDQTLKSININDIDILTDQEREATIRDLLSAKSGIYHPSAYSTRGMIKNLPERGSQPPGEFWYYNNWDFNALLTIYEQQTGKKFFEAFNNEIAEPIGMEDFEVSDCFYRMEEDKSEHPAYLFRMSARDMARFGQLYLQNGEWNHNRLISSNWIDQSTQPISQDLGGFDFRGGYGFLWWVSSINSEKMYYASGLGGHRIIILPESDLVIVHRVNTYENKQVSNADINEFVSLIINAQINKTNEKQKSILIPFTPSVNKFATQYHGSMDQFIGSYKHRFLGNMSIKKSNQGYVLENKIGVFKLYPASNNSFYPADLETLMEMEKAPEKNKKFTMEPRFNSDRSIAAMVFYY